MVPEGSVVSVIGALRGVWLTEFIADQRTQILAFFKSVRECDIQFGLMRPQTMWR